MEPAEVLRRLESREEGLSAEEAARLLERYGKNMLQEVKPKSLLAKFIEQFKNVMIFILLVAAVLSGILGEWTDTVIILLVVVLNAVLGVIQENKAEQALEALKSMSSPQARVRRGAQVTEIKSEELVPGDIVLLEAGNVVPADLRLLEAASLKTEEAALTGESLPSEKRSQALEGSDLVIGDRTNMAYMSSSVTYGRGVGVVTATGMNTEVGRIAGFISEAENEVTPLQKKLDELGKYFTFIILGVCVVIFVIGWLEGRELLDMLLTSISLAVAAIPEGLPAIVTIILALGVQRMAKRKAIIRKLPAVETLGSTEIICSDKTGTLTLNKMTVEKLYVDGEIVEADSKLNETPDGGLLLQAMTLCNDSSIDEGKGTDGAKGAATEAGPGSGGATRSGKAIIGDPTETALVDYALSIGMDKRELEKRYPRVDELPFDSDRKLMTTIHRLENGIFRVLTKGAPDVLVSRCSHISIHGEIIPLTEEHIRSITASNKGMADEALRVLAFAYRDHEQQPAEPSPDATEQKLVFIGLSGMIDPPREEVRDAVAVCRRAGIRPVMITGDHRDTAAAIATRLGIIEDDKAVLTGSELDGISEEDFAARVADYSVYARVSPEHKVRIVKAWRQKGKIVAMTGDGVNDAPALKSADIGVGMGITGTDVAKGVSDMVLADDNFTTIVVAVEEGRKVYSNIRKAIQFLLSANLGEVLTLFIATLVGWRILEPIHILWINLVTDTLPALALGLEKADRDVMSKKPRQSGSSIFAGGVGISIIYQGLLEAALTLLVFYWAHTHYDEGVAVTMAFATLGLLQITHAFNVRSNTKSLFQIGLFSNRFMLGASVISGLLLVLVIIIPGLNGWFGVQHLSGLQWGIVCGAALAIVILVELVKLVVRISGRSRNWE
ncbi:calcium-translocating P-type ATPase, SERCA-type [Paenibacillus sp. MMS20-IR301]|uniref:calcium-translocating P-type ATPase, SERCA-type n=1 Tax=Paenibacillus sp. MMS20-IR301 TaxID=2895946 RepID=UPI0028E980AD|nr:calcium-translocating P-type ATPase, SERCA-type [Paenibacillus sp. MMS20-IR301]WNS46894.1 calcium-translocating P-type ATPase, SERCA-type [Paenibacillus sp. MMS20-IR301]